MKKIFLVAYLILGTSYAFAASTTDMAAKWTCTTNASSSEVATEKAADEQMANSAGSAVDSFAAAAKNCRDCTKITCEAKD